MEYQLLDRMSYQRFCGLSQAANIPDRTTIWTFENRIGEAGAKALFDGMNAQLLAKGFIARGGRIIDATLVPAPKQHLNKEEKELVGQGATPADWSPAKRRQKDTDATWSKKHGKSNFGFKLSVNVDKKYKVIRKIATGTASTHDSQHFDAVLDQSNTSRDVYAEWGYPSEARERQLKEAGLRNHIQRKGKRNKPLSACQQRRNQRPCQDPCPCRACLCGDRADGRKDDSHDGSGAGELCHDDDGDLLQHEAPGVFHPGGHHGLLTPVMGRIAPAQGNVRAKPGRDAS